MSVLFFILILFGMWFFFTQAIYLPTYRYFQRLKIFQLRDEARTLFLQGKISKEVAEVSDKMIGQGLRFLPSFTLLDLLTADKRIEKDSPLKNQAETKVELLKAADCDELNIILGNTVSIIFNVSITNMIGLLPILIPILIPILLFAFLFSGIGKLKKSFERKSGVIALVDDKTFNHLFIH